MADHIVALARAARQAGDLTQATQLLQRAYAAGPRDALLLQEIGLTAAELGDVANALGALLRALALEASLTEAGQTLAWILQSNQLTEDSPMVAQVLQAMLDRTDLDPQSFVRSALNLLQRRPAIRQAMALADLPPGQDAWAAMPRAALEDPLLLRVLERSINRDPGIERMLVRLRRDVLLRKAALTAAEVRFAVALAQQAQNNEFVFLEQDDEKQALEAVGERITDSPSWRDLLRLCMYRPVPHVLATGAKPQSDCPDPVRRFLDTAAAESGAEQALRATIPSLAGISDATSRQVKEHYEENPYPRWFGLTVPVSGGRLALAQAMLPPPAEGSDTGPDLRVLIAGGGTGFQSVAAALAYGPGVDVLAIDLSLASLAYSARKAREYGVGNLRHMCCDLLEVGRLPYDFDVIECTGVLVCVDDPAAALRRLAAKLRPGGLMYLALYSEIARWDVVAARALIAEKGFADTPDDMRRFRHEIMQAPDSPLRRELLRSPGFYSLSTCRDFLFHKVEHRFTLEQVAALLDDSGLAFRAWSLPVGVQAEFEREAGAAAMADLARWAAFERAHPATFRGMYQFWCQKPATGKQVESDQTVALPNASQAG